VVTVPSVGFLGPTAYGTRMTERHLSKVGTGDVLGGLMNPEAKGRRGAQLHMGRFSLITGDCC